MKVDYAGNILISLRRIIQSIDQHNKQLCRRNALTVPQVVCLRQLLLDGETAPGQLARAVYLSQATVTGILDRLESKGLVARRRSTADRRKMLVRLTEQGARAANEVPWPLQERFSKQLDALNDLEKAKIDNTLARLVEMMEATELKALGVGSRPGKRPDPVNLSDS